MKRKFKESLVQTKEVLGLYDQMTKGRFIGGVVKDVIEHAPFEVHRLVTSGKLILTTEARSYLRTVYRAKVKNKGF